MKICRPILLIASLCFVLCNFTATAQTSIQGKVTDGDTGEELIGASIIQEGTTTGTISDYDGSFLIRLKGDLPINIIVSYIGYDDKTVTITEKGKIKVELTETANTMEVVTVTTSRISDKQKAAPLTVETMDVLAIKETPSDNFYDGLGNLKGVDLTAASLGFKVINTRGFNSTSPVRSLQIIDGVDNQAPGLNFSLGNFLGAPELDIRKVDIIQGASSSFYGPNAFNGVISMETKNPFFTEGLSAQVKFAERNMFNAELRWADSFKNKDGLKTVAYKITLSHLRADDWEADNDDAVEGTTTPAGNPGGWDKVNTYGDEYNSFGDFTTGTSNQFNNNAGLVTLHRPGYAERDLVDYDTRNTKALAAVYFRTNPKKEAESPELILGFNFGAGTTVYQGDNRFSLRNITFIQPRIEFSKRDDFFIRAYMSREDAGDSYDPYFTALRLQERSQSFGGYVNRYKKWWDDNDIAEQMIEAGYPEAVIIPSPFSIEFDTMVAQQWLRDNSDLMNMFHQSARDFVNAPVPADDLPGRLVPGTPEYEAAFKDITSRYNNEEGGTRFFDRSSLYHLHAEKKFKIDDTEITTGGNARYYTPNSRGTIFYDTAGVTITNFEYGLYAGASHTILDGKWRFSATARMDKNENFDYVFTPAASIVWKPIPGHYARASFSSAVRNPTLSDQYLFLDVGPAILAGNLNGADSLITVGSFLDYLDGFLNRDLLEYYSIDPIRPEKVRTVEGGYRASLFNSLYVDAGYYFSVYRDFIGFNIGIEAPFADETSFLPDSTQVFRYASNASDIVTTQGFSIGLTYYFADNYQLNGNYSYNNLITESDDPIVPAFNTPRHKFNIGFSGRKIALVNGKKNFGFNINYKWIEGFLFEGSPQFTGFVPSYGLLNGQINYNFPKVNSTIKLGATNILNNEAFQTYGGPRIGRLAYISYLYEFSKK